jgi:hypothetical protein
MLNDSINHDFPAVRPSASADASRAAELARLRAMTVEERVRLALSLHKQFSGLKLHSQET